MFFSWGGTQRKKYCVAPKFWGATKFVFFSRSGYAKKKFRTPQIEGVDFSIFPQNGLARFRVAATSV